MRNLLQRHSPFQSVAPPIKVLLLLCSLVLTSWVGMLQLYPTSTISDFQHLHTENKNDQFRTITSTAASSIHGPEYSFINTNNNANLLQLKRTHDDLFNLLMQRFTFIERGLQDAQLYQSLLFDKIKDMEDAAHLLHQHLSLNVEFWPLIKDPHPANDHTQHNHETSDHSFLPTISTSKETVSEEGLPELFYFPSELSHGRLLCFKGNDTSFGTNNSYGFAFKEGLPPDSDFIPGTTLVANIEEDFLINPWLALFSLAPFVHWKLTHQCGHADRLLLFHMGEYRYNIVGGGGHWMANIMGALGLPTLADTIGERKDAQKPVCFENAVLNRRGLVGVNEDHLASIFEEIRCQAMRSCGVKRTSRPTGPHVNVTLMVVRNGTARGFLNDKAWQQVVQQQCDKVQGCSWSVMYVANLTFCEQVERMAYTDIVVSAHGDELTNMIFMLKGGRIMEMLPSGWLELAGKAQYIYKNLARWVGHHHEGYWRDPNTPECPLIALVNNDTSLSQDISVKNSINNDCFVHFYKNQPVGINATYIGDWLQNVIATFLSTKGQINQLNVTSNYSLECNCRVNS